MHNILNRKRFMVLSLFCVSLCYLCLSCKDDYFYDEKEPDFLRGNIYDYLNESGEFTYFIRLINDLNYKDVLQKTGSKTLFLQRMRRSNAFSKQIRKASEAMRCCRRQWKGWSWIRAWLIWHIFRICFRI